LKKLPVAWLAILNLALPAVQDAAAAGYSLRALGAGPASPSTLAHVLAPSGALVLGESTITRRCPLSQWMACLVDGHTDHQPRAVFWQAKLPAPQPLSCLDTVLAPSATWDLPCEVSDINSQGVMVGRSYAGMNAERAQRAVMWSRPDAPPIDLAPRMASLPAFDSARAVGINDQGWVLGRARLADQHGEYAFLLRDGQAQVLPTAGAVAVRPVALNGKMALGEARYGGDGQSGVIVWHLAGGVTTLRDIASPIDHVYASGLSSAGHVTGAYWSPLEGRVTQAYLWFQGKAQGLQTDPGHDSRGHSVNAAGQVVGAHCEWGLDIRGCRASLWQDGVRHDLNGLVSLPPGQVLVDARRINDKGLIIGWMRDATGRMQGVLLTPNP